MAKAYTTLQFPQTNALDAIERGELNPPKGQKGMGLVFRITADVKNTAGAPANFDGDSYLDLLGKLTLVKLDFGKDGKMGAPFVDRTLRELEPHRCRCYRTELEGDSVAIGAGATAQVKFEWLLPIGKYDAWQGARDKNRLGMGRSQLRSVRAEFRRSSSNAIAGTFELNGSISMEIDIDVVPCKGDPWNPVPTLYFTSDARDEFALPEGLPLAIDELSSVYTGGDVLSNFTLKIDEAVIHEQADVNEVRNERMRTSIYFEAAEVSRLGGVTLYETDTGEVAFADLPTGIPSIRQDTKTVDVMSIRYTFLPILDAKKLREEIANIATTTRRKVIKGVSESVLRGEALPVRLAAYGGIRLLDKQDREYEEAPGLAAGPNSNAAQVEIPASVLAKARALRDLHEKNSETKAAEQVINTLAAAIPGTVQTGRGFSAGDTAQRDVIKQAFFK